MKADGLTVIMKRGFREDGAETWLVAEDGVSVSTSALPLWFLDRLR